MKKTPKQKRRELFELLSAIDEGRKHTHRNDILAPLSQADIITYEMRKPQGYPAINVRLTEGGKVQLAMLKEEFGLPIA